MLLSLAELRNIVHDHFLFTNLCGSFALIILHVSALDTALFKAAVYEHAYTAKRHKNTPVSRMRLCSHHDKEFH